MEMKRLHSWIYTEKNKLKIKGKYPLLPAYKLVDAMKNKALCIS